ncbi:MAG: hypothetical protein Q8S33_35020 [Myxococcales bacterium]|nr:hypothetical protein [Myxococcales bacterium]MDP3505607.1 hypothetical protein [Myxococcales bacterium]
MNWEGWSRDAASLMKTRTRNLMKRYALGAGDRFEWDLEESQMTIGTTRFGIVTVGTMTGDTFRWAWDDESIPKAAKTGLEQVRAFGEANGIALLTQPTGPDGLARGHECLAVAGRLLDASAILVDKTDAGFIFFALREPPS